MTTQVSLHEYSTFSLDVRELHSNANHQNAQLSRDLAGSLPVSTTTDIFFLQTSLHSKIKEKYVQLVPLRQLCNFPRISPSPILSPLISKQSNSFALPREAVSG